MKWLLVLFLVVGCDHVGNRTSVGVVDSYDGIAFVNIVSYETLDNGDLVVYYKSSHLNEYSATMLVPESRADEFLEAYNDYR